MKDRLMLAVALAFMLGPLLLVGAYVASAESPPAPAFECQVGPTCLWGQVTTPAGQGLRNATLYLTNNATNVTISTPSSSLGYYSFDPVELAPTTYTLTVASRRYRFDPAWIELPVEGAHELNLQGFE